MRNMSFAKTTQQVLEQRKTVTRRFGWNFLQTGAMVQPVKKAMGFKKGEKMQRLGCPIRIVSVRRERLDRLVLEADYGKAECVLEGFPEYEPQQLYDLLLGIKSKHAFVNRIQFEYVQVGA